MLNPQVVSDRSAYRLPRQASNVLDLTHCLIQLRFRRLGVRETVQFRADDVLVNEFIEHLPIVLEGGFSENLAHQFLGANIAERNHVFVYDSDDAIEELFLSGP